MKQSIPDLKVVVGGPHVSYTSRQVLENDDFARLPVPVPCSTSHFWQERSRFRSPESVIEELKYVRARRPAASASSAASNPARSMGSSSSARSSTWTA